MSPPSSIQHDQQSSSSLQPSIPRPALVADVDEYPDRSHCRSSWAVEDTRAETGSEGRRPEIEALVDWVLTPGSYESLRVDNAKKAGRMVNDVYGDVARRAFNQTGNGTTDDTTVSQRVHQKCPNFYEMLSIFPTPLLSKPINKTTAHSTGPTASAEAGKAEVVDIELSDDEVDNPRLTPMNAATEESDRSSSNRSSGSISLTQNLSSVVGSLSQALGSFSGDGAGASSSGRDYFMNRIE
ncbi:hypothetical protein BGX33_002832 [Mortierella sp. NVP41]|nr:hypothetical protein BGX33_002832 [Mortierella sp. NVP41]